MQVSKPKASPSEQNEGISEQLGSLEGQSPRLGRGVPWVVGGGLSYPGSPPLPQTIGHQSSAALFLSQHLLQKEWGKKVAWGGLPAAHGAKARAQPCRARFKSLFRASGSSSMDVTTLCLEMLMTVQLAPLPDQSP